MTTPTTSSETSCGSSSPEAVRAVLELKRRIEEGGVRWFACRNPRQRQVLSFTRKGCLVVGGNRSGKTVVGAVETVDRHLGTNRYRRTHRPPIRSWCVSQLLPGSTDKPHVQVEEIRRWAPADALRGGSWSSAYSPGARTLHWANGGVTEFKSYDQDLLQFESAKIHWVWFDEEPTSKEIWTSSLLRLTDYRGQWMMTLTPVLSLQGRSWVEELWEQRLDPDVAFECVQLLTSQNAALDQDEVERTMANLTDEERKVRSEGAFARVGGRVLSELAERHYVPGFLPPREWRHYLVIDPGYRNAAAGLFAAVDPEGRLWLYAEHYQKEWRPAQHMALFHSLWKAFGQPDYDVLMDPAGFAIKRSSTGAETPSDADEYLVAADELKANWFKPRPANNGDPFALRVKRYLATDMVRISRDLYWLRWEADRWTYQRERSGLLATEKPAPEAPVDRDNHLLDAWRYLTNELPDPIRLEPELPIPGSVEEHWLRERERLDDHEGAGGEWD